MLATFPDHNKGCILNGTLDDDMELELTSVVILFSLLQYFGNKAFDIRNCSVFEEVKLLDKYKYLCMS